MSKELVPCMVDIRRNCSQSCLNYSDALMQRNYLIALTREVDAVESIRAELSTYSDDDREIFLAEVNGSNGDTEMISTCEQFEVKIKL